ncbi:hypothetical protein HZI73_17090 [Vallitalea pronyensis]|uniref:DUF3021 domain-containing protein n=1 Tax=Vallitalea pronyensis TaxID=1348613 RepID=A0A8J8MLX8_9FIRM|nr:hypothetical protein [Vallitalea pronyensis]QUI23899.1 hypothetical protein HZI73_17090 [Vallitalea pronyensis]
MKMLLDRIITYAATGLVFFSINIFIRRPDARMDIFYYIAIGIMIGFIIDYFMPSKVFANPFLRYVCPTLVFNLIVFLWNLILSSDDAFLRNPSYWYTLGLLNIVFILASYLYRQKYLREKKRIQQLLERKIQETNK